MHLSSFNLWVRLAALWLHMVVSWCLSEMQVTSVEPKPLHSYVVWGFWDSWIPCISICFLLSQLSFWVYEAELAHHIAVCASSEPLPTPIQLHSKVRSWSLKSIAKHGRSYLCWITAEEHMLKNWTYIHHIIYCSSIPSFFPSTTCVFHYICPKPCNQNIRKNFKNRKQHWPRVIQHEAEIKPRSKINPSHHVSPD